jgi:hypothetical protein
MSGEAFQDAGNMLALEASAVVGVGLSNGASCSLFFDDGDVRIGCGLIRPFEDGEFWCVQRINSALTPLFWRVGDRIRRDVLQNERAQYGQQILATPSQELIAEICRGFDATNLTRMMLWRRFQARRLLRRCRSN